jgi:hypothetical protein
MKKLNPETGLPFKRGFIREDGFIFCEYRQKEKTKSGFFLEVWLSPESYIIHKERSQKSCKSRYEKVKLTPFGRAKKLISAAKRRASKNSSIVSVDANWVAQKIEMGVCEVTGLSFDLSNSNRFTHNPFSPSLDRIDSSNKNYTPDNTRVVLTGVNIALGQWGIIEMLPILKALISDTDSLPTPLHSKEGLPPTPVDGLLYL